MRVLAQRVSSASVTVDGEVISAIDAGLLLLVGIRDSDTDVELEWMAKKCAQLRIFPDEEGKMNRSLLDNDGEALVVSQFTLYGDTKKGNRPSFVHAGKPEFADEMYLRFAKILSHKLGKPVPTEEAPRRPGDPPELVADASRFREEFQWEPRLSDLDTVVATAWAWLQKWKGL